MMRSLVLSIAGILALDLAAMQVSITPTSPHCGLLNGSVTAWVHFGAVAPYTFLWNTGDTTETVSGLGPGTYTVTATDATNATATASVTLQNVATLGFPTSLLFLQDCYGGGCEATLNWDLEDFMGTAPYTYSPLPTSSTASSVSWALCNIASYNQDIPFVITDANGCSVSTNMQWWMQLGWFLNNDPQTLPSCNGGANGQVTFQVQYADPQSTNSITVLNASDQVVYSNGNYGDLWYGTIVVPGLLPGAYHTQVTSQLPFCSTLNYAGPSFTIQDMGVDCGTVTGDLFIDADNDCVQDGNEAIEPFALLSIQPGDEITFTDVHGHYIHNLQYGNYTIAHVNPYMVQQCPAVSPIPFNLDGSPQTVSIDIADSSLYGHDVEVHVNSSAARPGFVQYVWIDLFNHSLFPSGALGLTFSFDPTVQFISASVTPDQVGTGSVQWDLAPLAVYGRRQILIQFQVPPDVGLIGYELLTTATLSNTTPETNTANNVFTSSTIITGSLDPNDKLVRTSSGTSPSQFFNDLDEYVEYTIRFQNTGTDTAFTVVVRDTISAVFDLLSTEIIASSHTMTADVRNPRVLTFTFANIELPDSSTNEPASHGFVTFRIRPMEGLLPGASLANDADIYFDFNPPVITNNTELFVELSTAIGTNADDELQVYPNPANEELRIQMRNGARNYKVEVLSVDGRLWLGDGSFPNGGSLDVSAFPAGVYVLRATAKEGARSVRFVVK